MVSTSVVLAGWVSFSVCYKFGQEVAVTAVKVELLSLYHPSLIADNVHYVRTGGVSQVGFVWL